MARILYLGTAGSDDRTRAGFPFTFAMGAPGAGHQPEIFLVGEAVYLMKDTVTDLKGKNAQFINPKVIAERWPRPTRSSPSRGGISCHEDSR